MALNQGLSAKLSREAPFGPSLSSYGLPLLPTTASVESPLPKTLQNFSEAQNKTNIIPG
jgi:hypothetical protein